MSKALLALHVLLAHSEVPSLANWPQQSTNYGHWVQNGTAEAHVSSTPLPVEVLTSLLLAVHQNVRHRVSNSRRGIRRTSHSSMQTTRRPGTFSKRRWDDRTDRARTELPELRPNTAHFFASCVKGMEPILASELRDERIGAFDVREGKLGVFFVASVDVAARAVLWSRTALRIMHLLAQGSDIYNAESLYNFVRDSTRWVDLFSQRDTMSVRAVLGRVRANEDGPLKRGDWCCPSCGVANFAAKERCFACKAPRPRHDTPPLVHSKFTAMTVRNAIVDDLMDTVRWSPSMDDKDADVPLLVYVHDGEILLYRILSGSGSMHKRGYRLDAKVHAAALRETMAAGMLLKAGYDPSRDVLCDPMAGSGTIPIEAALLATNTAPGLLRTAPSMVRWQDSMIDERTSWSAAWNNAVTMAESQRLETAPKPIFANDVHAGALELARDGADSAGVSDSIVFSQGSAESYRPLETPSLIVTNPPWNVRLEGGEEAWTELRAFLKSQCGGSKAWVLSGPQGGELTRKLRMKSSSKLTVENGGVKLAILEYEVLRPKLVDEETLPSQESIVDAEDIGLKREPDENVHPRHLGSEQSTLKPGEESGGIKMDTELKVQLQESGDSNADSTNERRLESMTHEVNEIVAEDAPPKNGKDLIPDSDRNEIIFADAADKGASDLEDMFADMYSS